MLPTPSTRHIDTNSTYEPAEDSFLLLDTLSSLSESSFLSSRFPSPPSSQLQPTFTSHHGAPLIVELGPGSGVVIAFLVAQARHIFSHDQIIPLAIDVNPIACRATKTTVQTAASESSSRNGFAGFTALQGDLFSPLRLRQVDVLVFNPPYVPTADLPDLKTSLSRRSETTKADEFDHQSYLLELSYAGGADGMQVTNRVLGALDDVLSSRGVAYILLCRQNRPDEVMSRMTEQGWKVNVAGTSGKTAGWEKLVVLRIARRWSG